MADSAPDATDTPTPDDLPRISVRSDDFTGPEQMELQREFDCDWADLWSYVLGKASRRTLGNTTVKLRTSDGRVRFADEVLRHMIWVAERRTDPDAKLATWAPYTWDQLVQIALTDPPKAGSGATRRKRT